MESPANLSASRTAYPSSPADSMATHPFQAGEEARDFFYAEVEDNEPVPQLAVIAAARTAVRSQPPLIKPTPNIREPNAVKCNSAATRGRTEAVAPAGTFYVLTQLLSECATVQAAYVVPQHWHKSAPQRIRNIEYHIGFPRARSLNLDTRWNILFLVALFYVYYNYGGIMLIPTMATLRLVLKFIALNQKLRAANKPLKSFLEFFTAPPLGWRYEVVPVGVFLQKSIFQSTVKLPLDPIITNNLPAKQTTNGSPPMHSSPLKDHTERRKQTHAVPEPTWFPTYFRRGSDNDDNTEAGPSQKRVLDVSDDEDAPVAVKVMQYASNRLTMSSDSQLLSADHQSPGNSVDLCCFRPAINPSFLTTIPLQMVPFLQAKILAGE
ncbi:hypothetical protein CPB85DRAFT_1493514 [Mucidula mucida]|nr:hypothetical protein CPB85DRAFT_1493514 [Mucidula mucida]